MHVYELNFYYHRVQLFRVLFASLLIQILCAFHSIIQMENGLACFTIHRPILDGFLTGNGKENADYCRFFDMVWGNGIFSFWIVILKSNLGECFDVLDIKLSQLISFCYFINQTNWNDWNLIENLCVFYIANTEK